MRYTSRSQAASARSTPPRCSWRSERNPTLDPAGRSRHRDEWLLGDRRRRGQATGRKGVFAGGDVVSGAKTIIHAVGAGRRAAGSIHEYLSGCRSGEAEIMATVRVPKSPEPVLTVDLATRARVGMALAGLHARIVRGHPAQPRSRPRPRTEAARCFRCDAVYRCEQVHVQSGRGPRDRPIDRPTVDLSASAIVSPQSAPLAGSPGTTSGGRD